MYIHIYNAPSLSAHSNMWNTLYLGKLTVRDLTTTEVKARHLKIILSTSTSVTSPPHTLIAGTYMSSSKKTLLTPDLRLKLLLLLTSTKISTQLLKIR